MNKGRLVLGAGLIVLAIVIFYISSLAKWNVTFFDNHVDDEEKITTIDSISGIHSLVVDGVVTVAVRTGDVETVRYVYNNQRYRNKSTFENGVLHIDFSSAKSGFRLLDYSSGGIKAFVTVNKLKRIEMDGVGSLKSKNKLIADRIRVVNDGTGSMQLELDATRIKARNSGVGSLRLEGAADTASLFNEGVGALHAGGFITQVLKATNEGVGSMRVHAEQKIALRNSGVGSLRYSGDAEVTSSQSDGVGSISKR